MDIKRNVYKITGLTLLEFLVALSLFIILASMAFPFWHDFIVENRLTVLVDRVSMAIHFARSTAITRGQVVTFCGSADGQHCDGQWSRGQMVRVLGANTPLRHYSRLPSNYRLLWRSSLKQNDYLNFTAQGFTEGQQGTFYFCPTGLDWQSSVRLVITRSGRLRLNHAKVYASCSVR